LAVTILLPLVVQSLVKGSQPPEAGWLARYYSAEKHLTLAGNVFLLAVCASALLRLGLHFGYVPSGPGGRIEPFFNTIFAITLLVFLVLLIKAALKVHRKG
jgi:cytochrome c biogenesis factor